MMVKARFKVNVKAFKHVLRLLYRIENFLGINDDENDAGEPSRVAGKEEEKKKEKKK